jgi:hypothetical protein
MLILQKFFKGKSKKVIKNTFLREAQELRKSIQLGQRLVLMEVR